MKWPLRLFTLRLIDHDFSDFLFFRFFRIIDLRKNSRQILALKGLICKIFRNKDLEVPGFKVSGFQGFKKSGSPNEKGCRSDPHPFSLLYISIISIPAGVLDIVFDFIFPTYSAAYAENRQNRGLTGFSKFGKCMETYSIRLRKKCFPSAAFQNWREIGVFPQPAMGAARVSGRTRN